MVIKLKRIKEEIRILGWDDGPFEFKKKGKTVLVGAVLRGGSFMDGMLKEEIDVDGIDAEEKIIKAAKRSKFKDLRIIMLDGITFGGFNTVNIQHIYKKTGLPVIVFNRKKPDFNKFRKALKKLPHAKKRLGCVEDAGPVFWTRVNEKRVCFQCTGIDSRDAGKIIQKSATRSNVPEPLRIAHLIATAIMLGESRGRA
ncbi:MAG: DUF99 family protein [Candidatus Aenigmatarchaeota archaeon]